MLAAAREGYLRSGSLNYFSQSSLLRLRRVLVVVGGGERGAHADGRPPWLEVEVYGRRGTHTTWVGVDFKCMHLGGVQPLRARRSQVRS